MESSIGAGFVGEFLRPLIGNGKDRALLLPSPTHSPNPPQGAADRTRTISARGVALVSDRDNF
jgi:hypothetical protein